MKMYERPKTQVVWVRLTGSLLKDEQMTIGSKTMKVGESDAKQSGGTFSEDEDDFSPIKNVWND